MGVGKKGEGRKREKEVEGEREERKRKEEGERKRKRFGNYYFFLGIHNSHKLGFSIFSPKLTEGLVGSDA